MNHPPHILCISLSPALDRYITVNNFEIGKINRTTQVDERAGGKCINVSRAIRQIGGKPLVISALGGHSGKQIRDSARSEGIDLLAVRTKNGTRQYAVIWDESTRIMTHLSESWTKLTPGEWRAYVRLITQQLNGDQTFDAAVISGRMPAGVNAEEVIPLVKLITGARIPCFIDSAGDTLGPLLAARPTAVKINNNEAANYIGQPINTIPEAAEACQRLLAQGIELCVITMGEQGAVGATRAETYHVQIDGFGPWPVGSGDSFMGAMVVKWAQGGSLLDAMISGAAAGTANAQRQIAGLFDLDKFERGVKEAHYKRL